MKNGEKISVLINIAGGNQLYLRCVDCNSVAMTLAIEPKDARKLSRALHVYADIHEQLQTENWPEEKAASIEIKGAA